jgi:hypothetical protein
MGTAAGRLAAPADDPVLAVDEVCNRSLWMLICRPSVVTVDDDKMEDMEERRRSKGAGGARAAVGCVDEVDNDAPIEVKKAAMQSFFQR